jgi:hypothetical protein
MSETQTKTRKGETMDYSRIKDAVADLLRQATLHDVLLALNATLAEMPKESVSDVRTQRLLKAAYRLCLGDLPAYADIDRYTFPDGTQCFRDGNGKLVRL